MDQPAYVLENGTKIRTNMVLDSTSGMLIDPRNLGQRRANAPGVIKGIVGGHGGDVYWVEHEKGAEHPAAYCFTEFELDTGERANRIDIILDATNDD